MFTFTLVFLLLESSLVTTAHRTDQCTLSCPGIRNSLSDLKSDIEDLKKVVDYIRENLERQFDWSIDANATCAPGFTYLPSAAKCYQVVYESHDWYSAGRRCEGLRSGSHLAAITSATENDALKTFLASELSTNAGRSNTTCLLQGFGKLFWTSGQQKSIGNCQSPFVWRISRFIEVPFGFSSWAAGEPNCGAGDLCVNIRADMSFNWNDHYCYAETCPLCEYNPDI